MNKTKKLVEISMLSATAVILMLFEFPLPFIAPSFYEIDLSEIPVLIGAFAIGPVAGIIIEAIKILLNLLINGSITGGVGEFGNFIVGVLYILPAGLIYKKIKTKSGALIGLIAGSVIMVIASCFVNAYILIPTYGKALGIPIQAFIDMGKAIHGNIDSLWKLVLLCVAPFNGIKVAVTSVIVMFIYKPLKPILKI